MTHVAVYAEDLLTLNAAAMGPAEGVKVMPANPVFPGLFDECELAEGDLQAMRDLGQKPVSAHLLPLAPTGHEAAAEVEQLELSREAILAGMRDGARRVFEVFVPAMGLVDSAYLDSIDNDNGDSDSNNDSDGDVAASSGLAKKNAELVEMMLENILPLDSIRSRNVTLRQYDDTMVLQSGCPFGAGDRSD